MTKTYQSKPAGASTPAEVPVPEQVTIALGEIVESAQEGLLALAVGAGLQVMQALMADSVSQVFGPGWVSAWQRGRVGDLGRTSGAGPPPAGARRRRFR
jgi:hypothetical protein